MKKPHLLHASVLAIAIATLGSVPASAGEMPGNSFDPANQADPLKADAELYAAGQQQRRRRGGRRPSGGQRRSGERQQQPGGNIAMLLTKLSDQALALKSQGNCKDAIQMLACVVPIGQGFEVGQRALAECLVETGAAEPDSEAQTLQYRQAMFWAGRSADLGDADAQAFLAYHKLAGLITERDVMAGTTWYYIFLSNPRYTELGFGRLPVGTAALVRNQADDEMHLAARLAADAWRPTFDAPSAPEEMRIPTEACEFRRRNGNAEGGGVIELEDEEESPRNRRRRN